MTEIVINSTSDAVELLSSEINLAKQHRKITFKRIHEQTGLASSTISKLFYRETRFPRWATITTLLVYFGYSLLARKSDSRVVSLGQSKGRKIA